MRALLLLLCVAQLLLPSAATLADLQPLDHDPIAATRGLIARRLGATYNAQVRWPQTGGDVSMLFLT